MMRLFLQALPLAALLAVGAMVGRGFAYDEVNDIWWNLDGDYNGGHQTVCTAENFNGFPVDAVFNVFPAGYDRAGVPMPGRIVVPMRPFVQYRIYSWGTNYTGPGPQCSFLNFSAQAQ
jgi:hypothetical protein